MVAILVPQPFVVDGVAGGAPGVVVRKLAVGYFEGAREHEHDVGIEGVEGGAPLVPQLCAPTPDVELVAVVGAKPAAADSAPDFGQARELDAAGVEGPVVESEAQHHGGRIRRRRARAADRVRR